VSGTEIDRLIVIGIFRLIVSVMMIVIDKLIVTVIVADRLIECDCDRQTGCDCACACD
jgi:hypothetical protein